MGEGGGDAEALSLAACGLGGAFSVCSSSDWAWRHWEEIESEEAYSRLGRVKIKAKAAKAKMAGKLKSWGMWPQPIICLVKGAAKTGRPLPKASSQPNILRREFVWLGVELS